MSLPAAAPLVLQPLFPLALARVQLQPDPLDLALVDLCQAIFCLNEFLYIQ